MIQLNEVKNIMVLCFSVILIFALKTLRNLRAAGKRSIRM